LKKEFTHLRGELFPWSKEVSKCAYDDGLFRLDNAFQKFFKKKSKYPNFKRKHGKQSCELSNDNFCIKDNIIKLPKIGEVKLAEKLRFEGKIIKGVLSKRANQYFISITVEVENCNKQMNPNCENQAVGIDVGIKDFLILSDGTRFGNLRFFKSMQNRIRRLNKSLSRKVKDSSNWHKAKLKLQIEYLRLVNKRNDYLNKLSTYICENYNLICIEDLNVKGMVKNRKLSKALSELGIGEFFRQLAYKCKIYGNELIQIGRFFPSSKTCSCCGYVNHELTLADREWICMNCNTVIDRDLNAATNILLEGIRLKESTVGFTGTCS
jgi:putative transposase